MTVPISRPRTSKPTIEAKLAAWKLAYDAVLEAMLDEADPIRLLPDKVELIRGAAEVAASLVAGTDLGDGNHDQP